MPVELAIDVPARIVYSTFYGQVETSHLVDHISTMRKHPQFNPEYNELIDLSGVTAFNVSSQDLRDLASETSPFQRQSMRVLVAPSDLLFGLARMFQSFGSETRENFRVVRNMADAYRMLGLESLPKAQ